MVDMAVNADFVTDIRLELIVERLACCVEENVVLSDGFETTVEPSIKVDFVVVLINCFDAIVELSNQVDAVIDVIDVVVELSDWTDVAFEYIWVDVGVEYTWVDIAVEYVWVNVTVEYIWVVVSVEYICFDVAVEVSVENEVLIDAADKFARMVDIVI